MPRDRAFAPKLGHHMSRKLRAGQGITMQDLEARLAAKGLPGGFTLTVTAETARCQWNGEGRHRAEAERFLISLCGSHAVSIPGFGVRVMLPTVLATAAE